MLPAQDDRPYLFYKLLVYRRRKGEAKGFTWADYRDLILAAHRELSAPLVWIWDNLNIHLAPELADFAEENKAWLRIYRLPAYTPDLNPVEGIWSLTQAVHGQLRRRRSEQPSPPRQAQAEEDPVPAPPDQRLPGRYRPQNRTLVNACYEFNLVSSRARPWTGRGRRLRFRRESRAIPAR